MPGDQQISIPEPESIPLPDDIPLPTPPPAPTTESSSTQIPDLSEIELPAVAPPPDEVSLQPVKKEHQSIQVNSSTSSASHHEQKKRKRKQRSHDKDEEGEDSLNTSALRDEQEMMAKMMGFSNFDSTKGKQVPGNQVGAVHVVKKRRYRQYMNRKGGFNRPLDKVA